MQLSSFIFYSITLLCRVRPTLCRSVSSRFPERQIITGGGDESRDEGMTSLTRDQHDEQEEHVMTMDEYRKMMMDVCEVMAPLWKVAAELLGQQPIQSCGYIGTFYTYQFEKKPRTYYFEQAVMNYIDIWKCANEAIRCNMLGAAGKNTPRSGKQFTFTFVRDPISHFISGYSEINNKAKFCKSLGGTFSTLAVNSPERAAAFTKDVVAGRLDMNCWVNDHVLSMLGPMLRTNAKMDFVGKLEEFDEGWNTISEHAAPVKFPKFNHNCGQHPDSSDSSYPPRRNMENQFKLFSVGSEELVRSSTGMANIFERDQKVRLAFACAVLLPDYVCFDYKMAVTAKDCVDSGFSKSVEAWDAHVAKIKTVMCPEIRSMQRQTRIRATERAMNVSTLGGFTA